jgi:hypothetical protein
MAMQIKRDVVFMIDLKWKLVTEWWDESKEGRLDGLAKLV